MRMRLATCGALALLAAVASAQTTSRPNLRAGAPPTLRVFLDCSASVTCDSAYVRTAISYVSYVRDPSVADVHVLLTAEPTGSGGQVTTGRFIGRAALAGLTDTIDIATARGATDDEQRRAIVRLLNLGLVRFVAHTGLAQDLSISYSSNVSNSSTIRRPDPWHAWVFGISLAGQFAGQESSQQAQVAGAFTADHVTDAWRLDFSFTNAYTESDLHVDSVNETTIQRYLLGTAQIARSVSPHWSAGFVASASSSTFLNEELAAHFAPAVEFDVFPYAQATHHQLTFLYALGGTYFRFDERTIFDKRTEIRPDQTFTVALAATEPWGSLTGALQAAALLDDFRRNRQILYGDFRVRILSGLSIEIQPSVSAIHDQIYLPAAGATRDDILLARQQLATAYQYQMSVGLTFTFGSIFNGIVNPRFNRAMTAGSSGSPY
ncbi:MAG TPA: hypothetical protein VFA43_14860 [Gemmatimonadaceae bacterium]|nr:hypothetical protein [Gemmatimonadaceae bacterium]